MYSEYPQTHPHPHYTGSSENTHDNGPELQQYSNSNTTYVCKGASKLSFGHSWWRCCNTCFAFASPKHTLAEKCNRCHPSVYSCARTNSLRKHSMALSLPTKVN
eukprot:m.20435 g.20435  ORF g.20435 m.20435 type:complete len:104 (+) comp12144_c0_seq2:461-772(+)